MSWEFTRFLRLFLRQFIFDLQRHLIPMTLNVLKKKIFFSHFFPEAF